MQLAIGPPASPLPRRWWRGLSRRKVCTVVRVELSGAPRVMPTRHGKGYPLVYVGRGNPYSGRSGCMALHRWLMSRELGRRLATYEHVHHKRHGDKSTLDVDELAVLESVEHGEYHYGTHFVRDSRGRFVWVGCGREMTAEEIQQQVDEHYPEGGYRDE